MASSAVARRLVLVARRATDLGVEASIAARKLFKLTSDVRNECPRFFVCFAEKGLRLAPVEGGEMPTFAQIQ